MSLRARIERLEAVLPMGRRLMNDVMTAAVDVLRIEFSVGPPSPGSDVALEAERLADRVIDVLKLGQDADRGLLIRAACDLIAGTDVETEHRIW